jgi:nickel superoxide dismutase
LSMTKKLLSMSPPEGNDGAAWAAYLNTSSRYISIKEEQAHLAKEELLVLWTDYFKPPHLESHPELHTLFWQAAKLCSSCKVEVSLEHAQELMDIIEKIHHLFWGTKGRDVPWYTAS